VEAPAKSSSDVPECRFRWWLALVFLAGLLVFWPGAAGDFIYDDQVDIRTVDNVFAPGAWPQLFTTASAQLYRPVKYLSYYADNALFGWQPRGWHWQSFLWHAANGVLLGLLARRLGASAMAAALGGLWFAVHPVHAEAVVWISSRASLQSTLGVLVMLLAYDTWRREQRRGVLGMLLAGALIGFFSKEDALMIFPVIALYEWFIRGERSWSVAGQKTFRVAVGALGVVAVLYLALRQSLLSGVKQGEWEGGFSGWAATTPVILVTYLRQLVWPDPMCIDQPVDYRTGFGAAFAFSMLLLAGCAGFICSRRPAWARWQFALGLFFVTLLPVTGIIPINQPRADRFLYLPSVAAALALAWAWDWAAARQRTRTAALAGLTLMLVWFGWRSWDYSKTFLNDRALWENVLAINKESRRAFANLAALANNRGQPQLALELVERSLALKPDYPEAWVIQAYALDRLGRADEAAAIYRRAIERVPDQAIWLYLLADNRERAGQLAEADRLYDRVAEVRPGYVEARVAAGVLAVRMGNRDKAVRHWQAALRYDPANPYARRNLELIQGPPSPR